MSIFKLFPGRFALAVLAATITAVFFAFFALAGLYAISEGWYLGGISIMAVASIFGFAFCCIRLSSLLNIFLNGIMDILPL